MKKILVLCLALTASAVFAATEGTVGVPVLNARKEPTVKSPVMMRLKQGQKISIVRRIDENWLEIEAPEDAPVYVDESLVVGGKAHRAIGMFAGKGRNFPVWGELQKGEKVTLHDDRAYGWVRITPPERLRVYVVALYVDGADAVKSDPKELGQAVMSRERVVKVGTTDGGKNVEKEQPPEEGYSSFKEQNK